MYLASMRLLADLPDDIPQYQQKQLDFNRPLKQLNSLKKMYHHSEPKARLL